MAKKYKDFLKEEFGSKKIFGNFAGAGTAFILVGVGEVIRSFKNPPLKTGELIAAFGLAAAFGVANTTSTAKKNYSKYTQERKSRHKFIKECRESNKPHSFAMFHLGEK